MQEINGFKYSKTEFEEYKFRAKFEYKEELSPHHMSFDIYTDNEDKSETYDVIVKLLTRPVTRIEIVNWSSRESDKLADKIIEEHIKEDKSSENIKVLKLKCVKDPFGDLTIGRLYDSIFYSEDFVRVESDLGDVIRYPSNTFEKAND